MTSLSTVTEKKCKALDFRLFAIVACRFVFGLCYVRSLYRGCRSSLFPANLCRRLLFDRGALNGFGFRGNGRLLNGLPSRLPGNLPGRLAFGRSFGSCRGHFAGLCFVCCRRFSGRTRRQHIRNPRVVGRVRQEGHEPGLRDSPPDHSLMLGARAGLLARIDPRSIGYISPQAVYGLVVDRIDVVDAEIAYAPTAPEAAASAAELPARTAGTAILTSAALTARTRRGR